MNLINCSSDCVYQKDGYCCLDFIPQINSIAVEGCHYYKKSGNTGEPSADDKQQVSGSLNFDGRF